MFKVKLFEESTTSLLQGSINEWLRSHSSISVVHSNLGANNKGYTFYLLYTTTEAQEEALKEMALEASPGDVVNPTEINPEILKQDSIYNQ